MGAVMHETDEIRVLDHGFVRLDGCMADDLSVVNGARVSFAQRSDEMTDREAGLIRFLMRERHGSPFEHNAFRFHIKLPIFVMREWARHRIGCLTGDTEVTFVNVNGQTGPGLRKTIDELWHMWSEGADTGPARVGHLRLRVLNEATGEFGVGRISGILDKGSQPVYEVALENGKRLTMTATHRVLTQQGWATLREAVGLVGTGAAATMARRCALLTNGVVVPERSQLPDERTFKLVAHAVKVVGIRYVGVRQTYDLSVDGPWHNFVANGVVVHNSFNEWSGRYSQLEPEFYVPEPEDVRTQVGKPGSYSFETVDPDLAEHTRESQRAVFDEAYRAYEDLLERGVAKEIARNVLPVAIYTQFYWTVNARSLMNFLSLRNSETAQREIRRYAAAVEELFAAKMPITHAAFVANDRRAP
jgi:thymidylate synthase ThyX